MSCPPRPLVLPAFVLAAACASTPLPPEALAHNARGAALLREGELDAAEANLRLALEFHPRFAEPRANLGLVALGRGHLEAAEAHERAAIELNDAFAEAWSNLGAVLEHAGRDGEAREAYERALSIDPGLLPARTNLAVLHVRRGDLVLARAQLLRLRELGGDRGVIALLAYVDSRLGETGEAHRHAAQVLGDDPCNALARAAVGARPPAVDPTCSRLEN